MFIKGDSDLINDYCEKNYNISDSCASCLCSIPLDERRYAVRGNFCEECNNKLTTRDLPGQGVKKITYQK